MRTNPNHSCRLPLVNPYATEDRRVPAGATAAGAVVVAGVAAGLAVLGVGTASADPAVDDAWSGVDSAVPDPGFEFDPTGGVDTGFDRLGVGDDLAAGPVVMDGSDDTESGVSPVFDPTGRTAVVDIGSGPHVDPVGARAEESTFSIADDPISVGSGGLPGSPMSAQTAPLDVDPSGFTEPPDNDAVAAIDAAEPTSGLADPSATTPTPVHLSSTSGADPIRDDATGDELVLGVTDPETTRVLDRLLAGADDPAGSGRPLQFGTTTPVTGVVAGSVVAGTAENEPWWTTDHGLPTGAFDENIRQAGGTTFPLRATGVNAEAFREPPSPWAGLVPPKPPDEVDRDNQHARRMERQTSLYQLRRDLAGMFPDGAGESFSQVRDVLDGLLQADIRRIPLSLADTTPQAREAYLCIAAARCEDAPAKATIHAVEALARLMGSTGEMPPEAVDEVLAVSERGLGDLDRAGEIAWPMLPDARLATPDDPVLAELLDEIGRIAVPGASADLFASRFLREAQPAGPDGTPQTDQLPGVPPEVGWLVLPGNHLRALRDGTITPVELSMLETECQEGARAVCESGFRVPGSSASPNELVDPRRAADLGALNSALSAYWTQFQIDPGAVATREAWDAVEVAKTGLIGSMRGTTEPDSVVPRPEFAAVPVQPSEVARLTATAQTDPLDALFRNLPGGDPTTVDPSAQDEFVRRLLGANRVYNLTFPLPPRSAAPASEAGSPSGDVAESPDESASSTEEARVPSGNGGGVVVAPELPRRDDPIGDLIAGGWPAPPEELPRMNEPDSTPIDPNEFDPNRAGDLAPVEPPEVDTETFPARDEVLERILAPDGTPGLFTSPRGQEEVPTSNGRPVESERPDAVEPSPALRPAGGSALTPPAAPVDPVVPQAVRYAPLPGGGQGVVVDEQQFLGAPVSERDQVPDRPPVGGGVRSGDRVGSVGGNGPDGVAEPYSAGVGVGSAAGEASAGAGGSRVNSNGRRAVLVGSQVLVGDGRPGTSRGRVDFFRDAGGVTEAVVSSPRRVDGGDGTTSVWVPNLGVSVAGNVGAGGVTSVQRVESARFPVGASSQVVRLRTGEFTQVLAGGGEGSVPGSVSYRPVAGDPRVQDVVVSPSVTEVVNAGGSTTVTYSGLVPVNRQWNPLGAPERFRVAVGTQMREVQRRVVVAAPARVSEPVYEPAGGGAYEGVEEPVYQRSYSGGVELSPVLVPSRRPVSRPSVQVPAVRVPAVQPVPVRAPEPSWQDRAGRVAGQVGEGLVWTAVTVGGVVVWVLTGGGTSQFAP